MEETECGQNFDKKREEREIVGIVEIFKYPNLILQEGTRRLGSTWFRSWTRATIPFWAKFGPRVSVLTRAHERLGSVRPSVFG